MNIPTKSDVERLMKIADNNPYFRKILPNPAMKDFGVTNEAQRIAKDLAIAERLGNGYAE